MLAKFFAHARSNLVAYLALVVAMGGTSYAATQLPANSVGNSQLKADAVRGPKVKEGSLNGSDLKDNSLTGVDIDESSLGFVPGAFNAFNAANATNAQNATNAANANNAQNASNAQNATNAANAAQLGGVAAGSYALRTDLQSEAIHAVVGPGNLQCQTETGRFCANPNQGLCVNWRNWSPDSGAGFPPAGFYKDPAGVVHLRGRVIDATSGGAGCQGLPSGVFYLPTGYRPAGGTEEFAVADCSTGITTMAVKTDGEVTRTGSSCFTLSGVTFRSGG